MTASRSSIPARLGPERKALGGHDGSEADWQDPGLVPRSIAPMAISVEPNPSTLTVRLSGWDRVFALKGRLEIPLDRIVDVTVVDRSDVGWPPWLRAPGTFVPGRD
jgi:hypothetical protein